MVRLVLYPAAGFVFGVLAAVDGAFLGGIAAIISAVGAIIIAFAQMHYNNRKKEAEPHPIETEAEIWKAIALELLRDQPRLAAVAEEMGKL